MRREKIQFRNSRGLLLSGSLELPENSEPKAYAIFSHCFTCNKNLINVKFISESLSKIGIATLRYDFTGLGESEGDFSKTDIGSNIDDLIHAARFLEENYEAPKLLVGHSLGGAASILAASEIPSLKAVTVIGTPASLDHIRRVFTDKMDEIMTTGSAMVNVAGREMEIGKSLVEDLSRHSVKRALNNLRLPILVMHSPEDDMVGIDNATNIFMSAHHPKSFIALDGIDHLIKNIPDSKYIGQLIGSWVSRYL